MPGILSGLTSKLSLTPVGEKRPTFAFFRRLRDHPKLSQDALRSQLEVELPLRYRTVVPVAGDTIAALVEEWANEWLEGTRTHADVEKRLEGMVEEVAWGNVIWFALRGWETRGDRGRVFNADFFVCVQLHLFLNSARADAEQRASRHVRGLFANPRPSLGQFTLSLCAAREPRDASQGVPCDLRRILHFPGKWGDALRGVLRCHP